MKLNRKGEIGMSEISPKIENKSKKGEPFYIFIFRMIYSHPIISAALLCFFCLTVTNGNNFGDGVTYTSLVTPSVGIIVLGLCAGLYTMREAPDDKKNKFISFGIMSAGFIAAAVFCTLTVLKQHYAYNLLNTGLGVITGIFIYLALKGKLTVRNGILLIMAVGFLIRLCYIISDPITIIQHDVSNIGKGKGHIGYIEYLYNNKKLPDFDVRTVYQFYHPPLHHIIAAVWLKIQTLMNIKYEYAFENVQLLTLFYSTLCMILSYKIFRQLKLKGISLVIATAVVALCPTFYIMAGSMNNDILSITCMLGAILNTIYWYKDPNMKNIIRIALCIGLGMMAKLSVWMVAPAVAFIFIYVFIKNIIKKDNGNIKKCILQYISFLAVCAPLGLWWSVRNYISHSVPVTYVMELSETSGQYIGNIPVMQRLFDFSAYQFDDVAEQFIMYKGAYDEFNPLTALFKTAMFDEGIAVRNFPDIAVANKILFWSSVIIGIIGFISMIAVSFRKSRELSVQMKIFIGLLYSVIFISYYIFCFKFPQVCTQNIRYTVPLIVIGAFFVGYAVKGLLKYDAKPLYRMAGSLVCGIVTLYAMSGILVYDIVISNLSK